MLVYKLACEQAHVWVTRVSDEEQNDPAGRSLVKRCRSISRSRLRAHKLGNICCGHKTFLNKIRNIFCVWDTKFVSATNVARGGKRRNICVRNNVSSFARVLTIQEVWFPEDIPEYPLFSNALCFQYRFAHCSSCYWAIKRPNYQQ